MPVSFEYFTSERTLHRTSTLFTNFKSTVYYVDYIVLSVSYICRIIQYIIIQCIVAKVIFLLMVKYIGKLS